MVMVKSNRNTYFLFLFSLYFSLLHLSSADFFPLKIFAKPSTYLILCLTHEHKHKTTYSPCQRNYTPLFFLRNKHFDNPKKIYQLKTNIHAHWTWHARTISKSGLSSFSFSIFLFFIISLCLAFFLVFLIFFFNCAFITFAHTSAKLTLPIFPTFFFRLLFLLLICLHHTIKYHLNHFLIIHWLTVTFRFIDHVHATFDWLIFIFFLFAYSSQSHSHFLFCSFIVLGKLSLLIFLFNFIFIKYYLNLCFFASPPSNTQFILALLSSTN